MKLLLAFFLFCSLSVYGQQTSPDSLSQTIITPVPQQVEIKETPQKIGKISTQDTIAHYKKLLSQVNNDPGRAAQFHAKLADLYFVKKNDKEAVSHLLSAQKIYVQLNDKPGMAQVSIRLAAFYEKNSNSPKAEKNYLDAVTNFRELQDQYNSARAATHLSLIYFRKKEYNDALKYASYSLDGYTGLGIKDSAASTYVQMAAINMAIKNYRVAELLILKQALSLYRSAGNKKGRIRCFDVLGLMYHEQKRYSEAKWFFLQANTLARTLNDTQNIILSLVNVGKVKVDIGDYDLARKDFREAEALAKKQGYVSYLARISSAYSKYYALTDKPSLAKRSGSKSAILKDSAEKIEQKDAKAADKLIADANLQLTRPQKVIPKKVSKDPVDLSSNYFLHVLLILAFSAVIALIMKYYKKINFKK